MYKVLGIITVIVLVLVTAPYWLRLLNKHLLHLPPKRLTPVMKVLRAMHKPLGIALLLIAAIHGYLALRALRWHTGTLVFLAFAATVSLGIAFYRKKKPALFKWHKRLALVSVLLVLLHLIFPGALYYLIR